METKYKGKNIRVDEDAHAAAVDHCGKKIILGEWTSEAIREKIERETAGEKAQYDKKLNRIK